MLLLFTMLSLVIRSCIHTLAIVPIGCEQRQYQNRAIPRGCSARLLDIKPNTIDK